MISRHIAELLYDHECVVVPGFGGFIKSFIPASIHTATREIFPPKGKIAFNADLAANDGLLANYISTKENTSYREALYEIHSTVEDWHSQLKSGISLPIIGIGELLLNSTGQIEFTPDLTSNFNSDSYGLAAVHIKSVQSVSPDYTDIQARPAIGKQSKLAQLVPASLKWAAVLAPFIAFTLWGSLNQKTVGNYVQNYSGMFSWVRVTPGKTAAADIEKPKFEVVAKQQKFQSPASILSETGNLNSPATIAFDQLEKHSISIATEASAPLSATDAENNYHIIGGAFRDYNNAVALIAHLKSQGYDAAIVDTTARGLFMVSIKGVSDYAQAQQQLRGIKSAGYSSAWLFKLKKS